MMSYTTMCETKNWERLREMIETPEQATEALPLVAAIGDLDTVKWLVERGADVHDEDILQEPAENGHLDVIKYLVSNGANPNVDDDNAMCYACQNGHLDLAKYLVEECNANVNAVDSWSIGQAMERGDLPMVKFLFSKGVSPVEQSESIYETFVNRHFDVIDYVMGKCDLISYLPVDAFHNMLGESVNTFFRMTCRMISIGHLVPHKSKWPIEAKAFDARMMMLVNMINGTIRCKTKKKKGTRTTRQPTWGSDRNYDTNLGMLICSYID